MDKISIDAIFSLMQAAQDEFVHTGKISCLHFLKIAQELKMDVFIHPSMNPSVVAAMIQLRIAELQMKGMLV